MNAPTLVDGVLMEEKTRWRPDPLWSWLCLHCPSVSEWPKGNDAGGLKHHLRRMHGIKEPTIKRVLLTDTESREFWKAERTERTTRQRALDCAAQIAASLATPRPCGRYCPNCGAELKEQERNERWQRHFVCDDCTRAYHLEQIRLRGHKPEYELALGRERR